MTKRKSKYLVTLAICACASFLVSCATTESKPLLAGINQFDGEWEGLMRCESCEECPGPTKPGPWQKNVNIVIKDARFDWVPEQPFMAKGAIDDQGNVRIRPKYTTSKFSFDGTYDGESFKFRGYRGLRICTIGLSRATSPVGAGN